MKPQHWGDGDMPPVGPRCANCRDRARILTSIGGRGPQVVARERFLGQFARLSCGKNLHRALPRPRCLLAKLVGRSRIPSALGASRGARVSTLPPRRERRTRCRRRGTVTAVACPHLEILFQNARLKNGPQPRELRVALPTQLNYIRARPTRSRSLAIPAGSRCPLHGRSAPIGLPGARGLCSPAFPLRLWGDEHEAAPPTWAETADEAGPPDEARLRPPRPASRVAKRALSRAPGRFVEALNNLGPLVSSNAVNADDGRSPLTEPAAKQTGAAQTAPVCATTWRGEPS